MTGQWNGDTIALSDQDDVWMMGKLEREARLKIIENLAFQMQADLRFRRPPNSREEVA